MGKRLQMKKRIALFIFVILTILSIGGLIKYINYNENYVTSDAGFIKTETLTYLSFKIDGKINYLPFKSGDEVKKNELIASLDTKELNTTLNKIKFNILSLQNKILAFQNEKEKLINDIKLNSKLNKNQLKILEKKIEANRFNINSMQVELKKLEKDYKRYSFLYKRKKVSLNEYETFKTNYNSMKFKLKSAQKNLDVLILSKNNLLIKQKLIENEKNNIKKLSKTIESLISSKKAMQKEAKLIKEKIDDSFIYAPFNGIIAKKYVNNYAVIKKGQNIVTLVNPKNIYVGVFLEETKLKGLKIGNSAIIYVDALDKKYKAKVETILPVSEATFAIVPRDLSSGEFTKLTQRFIVKLKILNPDDKLRVGMSCEVSIKK
jgi:membrane fusion protein (multidrug efflux system)